MEYWLNINQPISILWGLNHSKAYLCAYYAQPHNWVRSRIVDASGDYLCIAITKLIKELPLIGKIKSTFSRELNELTELGIFDKIIDEDNKKIVYYRFNPFYRLSWSDNKASLFSQIESKNISICCNLSNSVQNYEHYKLNMNSVNIKSTSVQNYGLGVQNSEPIIQTYHINNNHKNINHNNLEDEKDDSKNNTKENLTKTEFEKLISIYPYTVNNTPKNLALAYEPFSRLKPAQRVDLFKAATNYSKTLQVKNHIQNNTSNFIKALTTFITKSYTEFIYGLPEEFTYAEEFNAQKKSNGAENPNGAERITTYGAKGLVDVTELVQKFESAKSLYSANGDKKMEEIKSIFNEEEYGFLINQMGGLEILGTYTPFVLADSLVDAREGA